MRRILYHLFVPHFNNNHRAALLHNSNLLLLVFVFLSFSLSSLFIKRTHPEVLGISYSISTSDLLAITNKVREENGLSDLSMDEKLSSAANLKAQDMFSKNYWAHFAPDGTSPWYFIKTAGYDYVYAGENLAKGFTTSSDVVAAWMNSPTHRDNILSGNYQNIGFAVVEGTISGEDTVLVVELFGSSQVPVHAAAPQVAQAQIIPTTVEIPTVTSSPLSTSQNEIAQVQNRPLPTGSQIIASKPMSAQVVYERPKFEAFKLSKSVPFVILFSILAALLIDLVVVFRRRIPRVVGHNLDHMMLIFLFILLMIVQTNGFIL